MTIQEIINELNNSNIIPFALTIFFVGFFSYLLGKSQQFKEDAGEIHAIKVIYRKQTQTQKAKAIKEFAENIKLEFYKEFDELIPSIMADKIDNLVKEMVGEQK